MVVDMTGFELSDVSQIGTLNEHKLRHKTRRNE